MCLKNYALHKQKNPFLPAFDSPVRPKSSEYSIPSAEAEIILVGTVHSLPSLSIPLLCLSPWLRLESIYLPYSLSLSKSWTDASLIETVWRL